MSIGLAALLVTCVMSALAGLRRPSLMSPVFFLVGFYCLSAIGGGLYYDLMGNHVVGIYNLGVRPDEIWAASASLLALAASFGMGALGYLGSCRLASLVAARTSSAARVGSRAGPQQKGGTRLLVLELAAVIVPAICLVLGAGASNIIYSDRYLSQDIESLKVLGTSLSPVALILAGSRFGSAEKKLGRTLWLILALVYQVIFFALATRRFAIAPVLFCIGMLVSGRRKRAGFIGLVIACALLPFAIQLPLALRSLPKQGLIPFVQVLLDGKWSHLALDFGDGCDEFVKNVFFSVPLTAYVAKNAHEQLLSVLVGLNPLPSLIQVPGLPQWSAIRDTLRVSVYVPYNSPGELLSFSGGLASAYYVVVGAMFAHMDLKAQRLMRQRRVIWASVLLGLSMLFVLVSLQYNLRSATRLLFYLACADLGFESVLIFSRALLPKRTQLG